jgi:hypothetical protein
MRQPRSFVGVAAVLVAAVVCQMGTIAFAAEANESSDVSSGSGSSLSNSRIRTRVPVRKTKTESDISVGSRVRAKWKMGLNGQSFATQDGREQVQAAGVGLGGKFGVRLLSMLTFRGEAAINLYSAQAQSRFGDNAPASGFTLKEALVQMRPVEEFSVSAGTIDQGHLQMPLLVSSRAFPGALERLRIGGDLLSVEVKAQQTVPTSMSLSTKTVESEKTPSFLSETLVLTSKPHSLLELKANGSLFHFRDLPSAVASASDVQGNTVIELGPSSSQFAFPFEGWTAGGSARLEPLSAFAVAAGVQLLQNHQAPQGYRNGQLVFGELELQLPREMSLKPRAEVFFTESDSAPAFYNSSEYGHNNRRGFAAELALVLRRDRFRIGARYVDSDVLVANAYQSRQQYVMVNLETLYESL